MHIAQSAHRQAQIVPPSMLEAPALATPCDCGWRIRCHVSGGLLNSATGAGDIGIWRVQHAPDEQDYCLLLEGDVVLTDDRGARRAFHAGESFVVPGGFRGTWENLTPVLAHFTTNRRVPVLPDPV